MAALYTSTEEIIWSIQEEIHGAQVKIAQVKIWDKMKPLVYEVFKLVCFCCFGYQCDQNNIFNYTVSSIPI